MEVNTLRLYRQDFIHRFTIQLVCDSDADRAAEILLNLCVCVCGRHKTLKAVQTGGVKAINTLRSILIEIS